MYFKVIMSKNMECGMRRGAILFVFLLILIFAAPVQAEPESWYYRLSLQGGMQLSTESIHYKETAPDGLFVVHHDFLWQIRNHTNRLVGFSITCALGFGSAFTENIGLSLMGFFQITGHEPGDGLFFQGDFGWFSGFGINGNSESGPFTFHLGPGIDFGGGWGWPITNSTRILWEFNYRLIFSVAGHTIFNQLSTGIAFLF